MIDDRQKVQAVADEKCDIKVWADSCQQEEFTSKSDKYLCDSCGQIKVLDHEMHHEHFPHMSGDKDTMH